MSELSCKFHPRRQTKLLMVAFERPCDCGNKPMYTVCRDCALALACSSLMCQQCSKSPGDLFMRDLGEGILFATEEMV